MLEIILAGDYELESLVGTLASSKGIPLEDAAHRLLAAGLKQARQPALKVVAEKNFASPLKKTVFL